MNSTTNTDDTVPVSQRVVEEVAAVTGTDPLEIEPLYTRVDPDCLESIFDDTSIPERRSQGHLTFPLDGCRVVIHADGEIEVTPYGELPNATPAAGGATPSSGAMESPD